MINTRGVQTFISTFGYGGNGALGNGQTFSSFVPIIARMNQCEIIIEISAGKSWNLARTINGDIYSWGQGLRGQLGLGIERKLCLIPEKIKYSGFFVSIQGSGSAHNICLAMQKTNLKMGIPKIEKKLDQNDNSHDNSKNIRMINDNVNVVRISNKIAMKEKMNKNENRKIGDHNYFSLVSYKYSHQISFLSLLYFLL